jgi:DNA-binding transcriptional MerR regulator
MRMKDVLARTGLSDRAVRLYIENGLLSPRQDSSYAGRKSITFSEEDVEILEVIATLRRAGFSLSDIRGCRKILRVRGRCWRGIGTH